MSAAARSAGGPAFPTQEYHADGSPSYLTLGMTLRDYFAAKALQGLLADPNAFEPDEDGPHMTYARAAYNFADAMMEARQ